MDFIFCWLSQVPNVVWSAIIASCLTFSGVLWTNKGSEKRQKALLEHEKNKFQAEQKLALKRDVFLELAASFSNVLGIITKLMDLDVTNKDINDHMDGHSGIVAKSYLSASEGSVAEILSYSSEVAESYLSLQAPRNNLLDHKAAIEIYQGMIERADEEKERILSIMKELNLQGKGDQSTFDYLNNSYDSQNKLIEETEVIIEEEENIFKPLLRDYAKKCLSEHGRLLSLLPAMTIALRKELDNNEDSEVFTNAINESVRRMKVAFDKLLGE